MSIITPTLLRSINFERNRENIKRLTGVINKALEKLDLMPSHCYVPKLYLCGATPGDAVLIKELMTQTGYSQVSVTHQPAECNTVDVYVSFNLPPTQE